MKIAVLLLLLQYITRGHSTSFEILLRDRRIQNPLKNLRLTVLEKYFTIYLFLQKTPS